MCASPIIFPNKKEKKVAIAINLVKNSPPKINDSLENSKSTEQGTEQKKKKKVSFDNNIVQVINIECWKEFNNMEDEVPEQKEKAKVFCSCLVY